MGTTSATNLKSGFLSSEFYLAIGTSITGVLVAIGVLTPTEADEFVKALMSVIGGVLTLTTMIVYINGRIALKREQLQNGTPIDRLLEGIPDATSSDGSSVFVK